MLIIYGLYYVEIGFLYANFLKSYYHKWVLNFVKGFFCIYWDYNMFLSFNLLIWCFTLIGLFILNRWKRLWCWGRLKEAGEEDGKGWDGWMASLTQWTWAWVSSGSWWWTGKPGVCSPWGHKELDMTEWLNWTELKNPCIPGITPAWSWCMSFLMCCWILLAKSLLSVFAPMFISNIGL